MSLDSFISTFKKWKDHFAPTPEETAGARKTAVVNGVEFAFRWCPAGTFTMGSPKSEVGREDWELRHDVTLSKGFWMMETPVTQKQWAAVLGGYPSSCEGDDLPVDRVSWLDCLRFCEKSTQLGLPLLLPTEAQWEYACRAGSTDAYAGNLDEMAWYRGTSVDDPEKSEEDADLQEGFIIERNESKTSSKFSTHPVRTKRPNSWGLYDMHGNVCEWCLDIFISYPSEGVTDPCVIDPTAFVTEKYNTSREEWLWSRSFEGFDPYSYDVFKKVHFWQESDWKDCDDCRVARGGSCGSVPAICRSASRFRCAQSYRIDYVGLRCILCQER